VAGTPNAKVLATAGIAIAAILAGAVPGCRLGKHSLDKGGIALAYEPASPLDEAGYGEAVRTMTRRLEGLEADGSRVSRRGDLIVVEVPASHPAHRLDRIRGVLGTRGLLEFKLVDDPGSTFIRELAEDIPAGSGIALESEEVDTGSGTVTAYYLAAEETGGRSGRSILEEFLAGKAIPEGRAVSLGSSPDTAGDGGPAKGLVWRTWYLHARAELTGDHVEAAKVESDPDSGEPRVSVEFDAIGAAVFGEVTGRNVKKRLAILLDDIVQSAPRIQEKIGGGRASITLGWNDDRESLRKAAGDLVVVLESRALPVAFVLVTDS
jgi:preprotein translocase subunit SecD